MATTITAKVEAIAGKDITGNLVGNYDAIRQFTESG